MSQRVLVVDDDADYRLVLRLALEAHPSFSVVGEAGDGRMAAESAAGLAPDLVLLDCSSPAAFEGLARLRSEAPSARVVLISGHDPADLGLASRAAGALGFLGKATPARRLAHELEALVDLVEAVQAVLEEASTRLARDPASARAARRFVRDALARADSEDVEDTVTLLVSELVTNAVVHGGSDVEVLVRLMPGTVRVEVMDTSEAALVPRVAADEDV
ncbi:MAG: response regulator, partial [Actinomycetota bacterium]|nr:response regulator [Actinomycetota bacterium]